MGNNEKQQKIVFLLWCETDKPTIILAPNATRTFSCKAWNSPVEYPSRECKQDIKESKGNIFNPFFKENVQGRKKPGSCALQYQNYLCKESLKCRSKGN